MPKPHSGMSVKELKDYIRTHGLHKALIPLSQKKAALIADLKKHGHWDDSISKAKPTAKPTAKPKAKPKKKAKTETINQAYLRHKKENKDISDADLKKFLKTAKNRPKDQRSKSQDISDAGFVKFAEEKLKPKAKPFGLQAHPKKDPYVGVKKKSSKERKPPPDLPGLEWKLVHDGKLPKFKVSPNFWEWQVKDVPSIKDAGKKTTDYSYVADVSKKDELSAQGLQLGDYHREGRIYDESTGNHLQYSVPEFKEKWRKLLKKQEKVVKKEVEDSIVGIDLGNPKSVKKGVKKLTESLQEKAMKDLDKITKEFTLANAKKALKKSKVDFLKFLDKSNKESQKINSMIDIFNKGIQSDIITAAEFKDFQRKVKQHQTTQRKIGGVFRDAFDTKQELDDALKKAGIKSLKR